MIFLYSFQFTITRARGHGTVYAMVILYSFQFRVTRARHYICHDISSCISVYDYASTLKPQKYILWYFFIRISSRLRGHGTIYAMIFLHAFQFTVTRARHYICHGISSCISVYDYASTLKPQKYMLWYFFIRFSSRLRGHGNVYAIIRLYSFQFTVTRARHYICHDISFIYFSSRLREHAGTRARHCICHYISLFISVHSYASTRAPHCICHNTSLFISVHGYASTALYMQ